MTLALQIWRATDQPIRIQVYQRDDETPQDMNGWDLEFTVRKRGVDDDAVLAKDTISIANGDPATYPGEEITGPNSVAVIPVAATDTASIVAGVYECDLKRMDIGQKAILADGTIEFLQEKTR